MQVEQNRSDQQLVIASANFGSIRSIKHPLTPQSGLVTPFLSMALLQHTTTDKNNLASQKQLS